MSIYESKSNLALAVEANKFYFGPKLENGYRDSLESGTAESIIKLNDCIKIDQLIIPNVKIKDHKCTGIDIKTSYKNRDISIYCTADVVCPPLLVGKEIMYLKYDKNGRLFEFAFDPNTSSEQKYRLIEGRGINLSY